MTEPNPPRVSRVAHSGGLPFDLALFFAVNPDESLTIDDIAVKFGVRSDAIPRRLSKAVMRGYFTLSDRARPGQPSPYEYPERPPATYSAGPLLVEMVGGHREHKRSP